MQFEGNDNYGKPKSEYLDRIASMTDDELSKETANKIWLSAYAANNKRSDYHWHVDALYAECVKRDPSAANYQKAWDKAATK